ncbi:hypothetical protein LCGC14_2691530 [marine sediment metagenome]|uniref:Uncharacterized protein n=1 Tax=marine sediment metagenome TaxID=412755 RepID=A0A0F8ZIG1_9ZZZZ
MNETLTEFAKKELKEGLAKCSAGQHQRFKQMYAKGDMSLTIAEVVDGMTEHQLDRGMEQVEVTLSKIEKGILVGADAHEAAVNEAATKGEDDGD